QLAAIAVARKSRRSATRARLYRQPSIPIEVTPCWRICCDGCNTGNVGRPGFGVRVGRELALDHGLAATAVVRGALGMR
ncbi:MAG TPA: hypothetical protein VN253_11145, partial [Kofleriaceae bacterium]|nr:hypothetical protein [Kofleriaceae bacterium]